jgi:hypothetical protein
MPYQVSVATTPVWADQHKTLKKGRASLGAEFVSDEFYQGMLHTKAIPVDGGKSVSGWVDREHCTPISASTEGPVVVTPPKKRYRIVAEIEEID